jgi:carbonic anhydrase
MAGIVGFLSFRALLKVLHQDRQSASGRINMNNLDCMLRRNKEFAAEQSAAGTLMPSLPRALPQVRAVIIGCADMRVDPAHVFGIKPGEAVVMRNIGGRITPGLLEQLGLLGRIGAVAGEIPGGGGEFHIIVLQHTDCGITRLAGDPAMLTHYFQIQEGELKTKALTDPARRLPSTLLGCGRFPHCRPSGLSPASFMTWRPDWLKSSYRQRPFALRRYQKWRSLNSIFARWHDVVAETELCNLQSHGDKVSC